MEAKPKAAAEGEEGEETEAAEEENGDVKKSRDEQLIDDLADEETDKALELELLKYIRKRQELEREENLKAGFTPEEEAPLTFDGKPLSDEDLERLMDLHRKDRGLHLNEIEDEEEYKEAWLEWVKTKVPNNYRINPKPFNEAERFER